MRGIDIRYPAAQIVSRGGSAPLDTGSSTVIAIPRTSNGERPSFVRISVSANAAYTRMGIAASSTTATTGDTIVTSTEALYLNCLGLNAIAARAVAVPATLQISPCEEGVISPPTVQSVVG